MPDKRSDDDPQPICRGFRRLASTRGVPNCRGTQTQVCEAAELTHSYLIALEHGRKEPSGALLVRLAAAVNVEPIELLRVEGVPSLAQLRACTGQSQDEVAFLLDRSDMSYSRLERGETSRVHESVVAKLARVLRTTPHSVRAACEQQGQLIVGAPEGGEGGER